MRSDDRYFRRSCRETRRVKGELWSGRHGKEQEACAAVRPNQLSTNEREVATTHAIQNLRPKQDMITIRPAAVEDADEIARAFLESAEDHATLDPERYSAPAVDIVLERYREGRQHPPESGGNAVTLVAELGDEVVGFVDSRLERSPDPMHRDIVYCQVTEIAVCRRHRNECIGEQLLRAAEDWGREQGAQFAILEFLASNMRASRFYQHRMGYSVASITAIKRLHA